MSCFKKGVLSMAALTVSAVAFAGPDLDTRVRELEKEMKQVRTDTAAKTYGANTATARPDVDGKGFFFSFDVLYWQVKTDATTFGTTNTNASTQQLPLQGCVKQEEFEKWNWGFRAGAGYNFEHGDWDVYANYTYYTNTSSSVKAGGLIPMNYSTPLVNGAAEALNDDYFLVESASSKFKFNFSRVDLELGRDFFVAKYLSLRPHIGLMTAWSTIKQETSYTGQELLTNSINVENENKYWGIGPRTGLNTKWHLCNNFSIVGNTSAGLVYGDFKVSREQEFSLNKEVNRSRIMSNPHRFTPTAQMQLGLGYDNYTTDCKQHVSMFLGWDIQYWWDLQQIITPNLWTTTRNLSLQGVTYSIRVDF